MEGFLKKPEDHRLERFIEENRNFIFLYMEQLEIINDAERNIKQKFQSEYKLFNPKAKRGPPLELSTLRYRMDSFLNQDA